MVPALGCGGSLLAARGDGFGGATFCFFFAGSGSREGEADTAISSSLRFFEVFLPVVVVLAVGELALRFKEARALDKGLKRFLKADPISPRRRAASSASWAASAARSRAGSIFLSFLSSGVLGGFGLGSGVATTMGPAGGSTLSGFEGGLSSMSMNLVPLAWASALAL